MNPEAWLMDRSVRLMALAAEVPVLAHVVKDPVTDS